jgi:two-component system NtrC family sensor kinase
VPHDHASFQRPAAGPGPSPWTLRTLFIASIVGPAVIAALVVFHQYHHAEREAYGHVRYTLGLLHEHAQRVFEIYDLVMDRAADRIRDLGWEEIRARAPALHQDFNRIVTGVEQVGSLFLVDPTGRLAVSAIATPTPDLQSTDRDYFRAHVDEDRGTFVDGAVLSRLSGRVVFNLSERKPSADGSFNGVIALVSEQDYWLKFYGSLNANLAPSVSLVRAEGDTLVRFPRLEFGQARPSEQFMQSIREKDEGYYEITSRADNSRRIIGYRKLAQFPVYVVYTVSKDAVLASWRFEALMIALAAACASLVLLTITFLLRQRMRLEWHLQAALSDANRNLEANVAHRTEELSRALREKEILLREVHHRVKNNLQMIASMIRIVGRSQPPKTRPVLEDVTRRIVAVGQVYDQIHKADDLARLQLGAYLQSVCDQLSYAFGHKGVSLRTELEPIMVDIDTALPAGLIAQELVSNAFKHGLSPEGKGEISVSLKRTGDLGVLTVRDSGAGLRAMPDSPGMGLKLVERLALQIDGILKKKDRPGGGAQFRLIFAIRRAGPTLQGPPSP